MEAKKKIAITIGTMVAVKDVRDAVIIELLISCLGLVFPKKQGSGFNRDEPNQPPNQVQVINAEH